MKLLLLSVFFWILYITVAAKIDEHDVEVMKDIGKKFGLVGKKEWDLSRDPCSLQGNWGGLTTDEKQLFQVICACPEEEEDDDDDDNDDARSNTTTCHLERITISQNISSSLPSEFTYLKRLRYLNLDNNYFHGTIPSQWENMSLIILSLTGNQLTGQFPAVLTKMTTLKHLYLDINCFSGTLPKGIANLINLETLVLSSNGFTGQLPTALDTFTKLITVRISDNNFNGTIPNFISKWTQIQQLHIEGCSFEGPIPSNLSALTQLQDLRISNLKGHASAFPSLHNAYMIKTLVLRNCLIHGTIPDYVGNLTSLQTLDLSFNNLNGTIPSTFSQLTKIKYMYLTANNLSGPMPRWVLSSTKNVDVSYNQFTWDAFAPKSCEQSTINVVESYSLSTNKQNNINPCLRKDFPCTKSNAEKVHSLHINCGGGEVIVNTLVYESDLKRDGASTYHKDGNWAFSSTGNFLDGDADVYIVANASALSNISISEIELYTKVRTAAISLTYYGLCLLNGNYTVKLHFAEIVFTHDDLYTRLGRRVFDVYVQDELKQKDFDIVKEAGGAGIAVIKIYKVMTKYNTLKIRLYWAGKGTTVIAESGNYGPIISAISVEADFEIPNFGKKIPVGIIVGTVGGGLLLVFSVIFILWRKGYIMKGKEADTDLRGLDMTTCIFTLRMLKAATKNFDQSNKLGEGGFGAVYKGLLLDGTIIAVKQLSSKSKQGAQEFVNEITMISALRHPNLVRLHGCCVEGNQMSLVYEYMANNCLSRVLFGADKVLKTKLTWPVRVNICKGIARGLLYLQEESELSIIHRDIKASNILLDEHFNAKISDFGLAKLNDDENTHIDTRVAGTVGYMAPEYALRGYLTPKADIYSFGVVMLEIVSGKSNNYQKKFGENHYFLLDWARRGNPLEVVDPDLGSNYSPKEALTIINVAMLCTRISYNDRPTISQTVNMLEGRVKYQNFQKGKASSISFPEDDTVGNRSWQDRSETRPKIEESYTTSFVTEPVITKSRS